MFLGRDSILDEMLALQCKTQVQTPANWLEAFQQLAEAVRDDKELE